MAILSAQTIRRVGIISPLRERSVDRRVGMSWGLSIAGYDIRIKQKLTAHPGRFYLASSVEKFSMPDDVLGKVADKSSLARIGIAVQNTIIEPGWIGYLTIEITNHGYDLVQLLRGQPISQIIFERLDAPAERPYSGKYQHQPNHPVPAIRERVK